MTNAPAVLASGAAQASSPLALEALWIHLAAVYPPGSEPAIGGQDTDRVAVNGRELATTANAGLATIAGASLDLPLTGLPRAWRTLHSGCRPRRRSHDHRRPRPRPA